MAHMHNVYDTDAHFKIDAISRAIRNVSETRISIVQYDHNSERLTFEIPRYIDGHDMSTCNSVAVHYINSGASAGEKVEGVYTVDDLQISPDADDVVICSWLISRNATQHAGTLHFLLRFVCSADGEIDYAWDTAIHTLLTVAQGIYNSETVIEPYNDVLEQLKDKAVAEILNEDGETWIFTLEDGSTVTKEVFAR